MKKSTSYIPIYSLPLSLVITLNFSARDSYLYQNGLKKQSSFESRIQSPLSSCC